MFLILRHLVHAMALIISIRYAKDLAKALQIGIQVAAMHTMTAVELVNAFAGLQVVVALIEMI